MDEPRSLTPEERAALWKAIEMNGETVCPDDGSQLLVRKSLNDIGGRSVYFVRCTTCGIYELID